MTLPPSSRLLMILALVFFIGAALLAGGVITGSGLGWLLPGGLASMALAFIVPLRAFIEDWQRSALIHANRLCNSP